MKHLLSIVAVLLITSVVAAGEPTVKLTVNADTVDVTVGGKPFAVYNFSKDLPKPFFSPVRGPGGAVLTRPIEKKGDDHPHHKGIWVAVDEINGIKFWAEKGKIVNVSVREITPEDNPPNLHFEVARNSCRESRLRRFFRGVGGLIRLSSLSNRRDCCDRLNGFQAEHYNYSGPDRVTSKKLQVVNQWIGADDKPVVTETTLISIYANGLLSYDIRFTANREKVTFEDTKEGLLGFRMVDSMRESEGGHVVNAEGLTGTKACWGKPSNWIDYYGDIDGKTYGVTIMDHPKNFRPSRYHVRNYGLFSISPFGEKAYSGGKNPSAPVHLAKGKTLRLRYGMYIHAGDTETAKVSEVYQQFVKAEAK